MDRPRTGPPEVGDNRVWAVDAPAPGLIAGVKRRVVGEAIAHLRPVPALDRGAEQLGERH